MSSRDRSLIALVVLVLVVVVVVGYFVVVAPEHHRADRLTTQIGIQQAALSQAEVKLSAGEAAERKYRSYVRQLRTISTAVPSDDQIPGLINELQAASSANHVGFQTVSLGGSSATATSAGTTSATTSATSSFPSESFSLSFSGSYDAVANLLGTLDSFVRADDAHFSASGRLLSIGSVSLSPNSARSADVTASVTAADYDVPNAITAAGAGS